MLVGCMSEDKYLEEVDGNVDKLFYALDLMGNETFYSDVSGSERLRNMEILYDEIRKLRFNIQDLEPPSKYEKEHEYLIGLFIIADELTYYSKQYVDKGNSEDLDLMSERIEEYQRWLNKSERLITIANNNGE